MSDVQHKSHTKEYLIVFAVLALLTALELMVPSIDTAYAAKVSALIFLAVGKAFVVAYFYMHLNEESAWLRFIAAIPISAGIYALVVILESVYR